MTPDGKIATIAGDTAAAQRAADSGQYPIPGDSGGDGGPATSAHLNGPRGISVDEAGNVYIAEEAGARIRRIDPSGKISTIAGNGKTKPDGHDPHIPGDPGPAPALEAQFHTMHDLNLDKDGEPLDRRQQEQPGPDGDRPGQRPGRQPAGGDVAGRAAREPAGPEPAALRRVVRRSAGHDLDDGRSRHDHHDRRAVDHDDEAPESDDSTTPTTAAKAEQPTTTTTAAAQPADGAPAGGQPADGAPSEPPKNS